jgi:hypothetical protein
MKKLCIALFAVCLLFTGCSKIFDFGNDNDNNGGYGGGGSTPTYNLTGTWSAQMQSYQSQGVTHYFRPEVTVFVDNNTLKLYGRVYDVQAGLFQDPFPSHSGWYYYGDAVKVCTYTVADNKVYVPSAGLIYTISGNSLLIEGTNKILERW